ncbi:kinase-like domain-containing protein [Rhizophagus clarus]|uniref:Kinase-like domain-containing protein n=2 Tax=Rhizophagus clarus TaxID=94130 RepID=A0A8H3KYM4_9GLOM|nr:kinase-like domain-containing protein [Rhizophagus clarus]
MDSIRKDIVFAAYHRAYALMDVKNQDTLDKKFELLRRTIPSDKSLTKDEKSYAIKLLNKDFDTYKILRNEGTKRICGCSEIYGAYWIDGCYDEWDSKEKKLKRYGAHRVVLKKLENVESANRSWFDESKFHLCISNKHSHIVQCYGLTKNPLDGNYILVIYKLDYNLKEYLYNNHNKLTWEKRIQIIDEIVYAVSRIHSENAIHRDLHSGNVLYHNANVLCISDLGFCGPADKPLNSIYGNLPYIAPEVISGKGTSFASDIYSIGMLMWEISSGQSPFINFENDYELALKIISGMRPKIIPGTPLEYKKLMVQCWEADPTKRPDINTLFNEIAKINRLNYQNESNRHKRDKSIVKKLVGKIGLSKSKANTISKTNEINILETYNNSTSRLFTSKVYQFKDLPEPKNATEEEQEAFHSKPYGFSIPYNIEDFDNKSNNNTSKSSDSILKDDSKKLSKIFENMQINSNNDNQVSYKEETTIQQVKKHNIDDIDDDEMYDTSNFHSEEQADFEIPNDGF